MILDMIKTLKISELESLFEVLLFCFFVTNLVVMIFDKKKDLGNYGLLKSFFKTCISFFLKSQSRIFATNIACTFQIAIRQY